MIENLKESHYSRIFRHFLWTPEKFINFFLKGRKLPNIFCVLNIRWLDIDSQKKD